MSPAAQPAAASAAAYIASFARETLSSILGESGVILNSPASSLARGDFYFMAVNPGGDPLAHAGTTLARDIEALPHRVNNNYFDDVWPTKTGRKRAVGTAPMQRRVLHLFKELAAEPRDVAMSNAVFLRSARQADIRFDELADLCWPVHQAILEVVQPRCIVASGDAPYRLLAQKLGKGEELLFPSGHGDWQCRSFRSPKGVVVVLVPHLARYSIIGKTAVLSWIKSLL